MSSKNCPESTRQKMINMMYLVLTAMLALNVASEVLESFRIVDASLTQTLNNIKRKNDQIYGHLMLHIFRIRLKLKNGKIKPIR